MFASLRKHLAHSKCGERSNEYIARHSSSMNLDRIPANSFGFKISINADNENKNRKLTNRQFALQRSHYKAPITAPPHYDCNVSELSAGKNHNVSSAWTLDLQAANQNYRFEAFGAEDQFNDADQCLFAGNSPIQSNLLEDTKIFLELGLSN
jgi:hypothetical protein